jgi:putative aldouronate transport system substrate-binding protein
MKRLWSVIMILSLFVTVASGCTGGQTMNAGMKPPGEGVEEGKPFPISIVITQVGDIPAKGNEVERLLEQYTNTRLDFQWIPSAAYEDKISVMIASGDLPVLLKVEYTPSIVSALESGLFWDIGPHLKSYKNLVAQDEKFYHNISVDGKIYGVPLFRPIGRGVVLYRKDWFNALNLSAPQSIEDWYGVIRALAKNDPDRNGKDDTYGMLIDKKYNSGADAMLTRLAVSLGAPNKWEVDGQGNFTPEFMTAPYYEAMKLLRRLYEEKLINSDFAVVDSSELEKHYDTGRAGLRISGGSPQTLQDRLLRTNPNAVVDTAPLSGPQGIRVPGESGNAGFLVIAKSAVKTEADLHKVLKFLDQLMDPDASMLLQRGIKNRHYQDNGFEVEHLDKEASQREIKPYRDNLPYITDYNVKPFVGQSLAVKYGNMIHKEYPKYVVSNPALVLASTTNAERGRELEEMIEDAQTKFIMGKMDEAGWKNEVERWKKAGGVRLMEEYKEAYRKVQE